MASAENKKPFKKEVKIFFVIPQECSNENETNDTMKMAFQECEEAKLVAKWLTAEEVIKVPYTKTTVFVFQEFSGDIFNKLRTTKSVRICGPMCLRSCLMWDLPIPDNKSPVFTTAMRGLVVTASQVSPEVKSMIKEKVGFMGGVYSSNFTEPVTHLITNAVRSAKYEMAGERGVPIMRVEWVDAVWKESQEKNISATDPPIMMKYKCPIFLNMFVTTSNLPKKEKEEIKALVIQHGGTYTARMHQSEITLVVISDPRSEKYKYARMWEVPCVKPQYIYDSVQCGYARPSKDYLLLASATCSTPTKDDVPNCTFNTESSISMINFNVDKTQVDDTQVTVYNLPGTQQRNKPQTGSQYHEILQTLTVSIAKKAGSFLDGCKVFLSGFSPTEAEKLQRILSLGGATVFSELSDSISHVIIGEFIVSDMRGVNELSHKPHIVTLDWLAASIQQRCPAREESYYCLEFKKVVPEPPSPLSQKGMQLLKPASLDKSEATKMPPPAEPPVSRKLFSEFVKENAKSPAKQHLETNESTNSSMSTQESVIPEIFIGQKFVITNFESIVTEEMEAAIEAAGGQVVPSNFTGIADYAVVPCQNSTTSSKVTAVEVVTNLWLEDCLESKELIPIQYYHQPFTLAPNKRPLSDCCISISSYFGKEKLFLIELVQELGAIYQDLFARVAKQERGVIASTHLVCPRAEGQKHKAATRWGLPVVTSQWLLTCARLGTKVPLDPFYVSDANESAANNKQEQGGRPGPITPTVVAPTPQVKGVVQASSSASTLGRGSPATPLSSVAPMQTRQVSKVSSPFQPPVQTSSASSDKASFAAASEPGTPANGLLPVHPVINSLKRKSNISMSDSPFHVATPETPYGQVFETPTNESKKRWKKWIDNFPSQNMSSPSQQKNNRLSTPLSEIKRKIWATALQTSESDINPNYSIEEMDEDPGTIEGSKNTIKQGLQTSKLSPARGLKLLNSSSSSNQDENVQPHRFSTGWSTPTANDFRPNTELSSSQKKSPTKSSKSAFNEKASAMLGKLQERLNLSSPRSASDTPQPLPQRELVEPVEQPNSSTKPVSTNLLPESQPILIGWEDPVESAERAKLLKASSTASDSEKNSKKRKFVLSNVNERETYEARLKELGETVISSSAYDDQTTHLIMDLPVRSEKLLCCLAAGKWVLHTSYIDEMMKHKKQLPEEDFEWGNPKSAGRLPSLQLSSLEQQLANAAYRWRTQNGGVFSNMQAVLIASGSKFESYQRLITAGGGVIIPTTSVSLATHCFVEPNKVSSMPVPLSEFVSHLVPCLPPIFLGDMLIKYPHPRIEDCLVEDYRKMLMKETRKS